MRMLEVHEQDPSRRRLTGKVAQGALRGAAMELRTSSISGSAKADSPFLEFVFRR